MLIIEIGFICTKLVTVECVQLIGTTIQSAAKIKRPAEYIEKWLEHNIANLENNTFSL